MIRYRTLLGAVLAVVATCVVAAELTLYEGENFQGRSLTLRNDMRDLDRTNFNDRAMSLVIRDGVWEVCSDAQFHGHCATLRPGNYPALEGGLDRRISSVRQVAEAPVAGRTAPPTATSKRRWPSPTRCARSTTSRLRTSCGPSTVTARC